MITLHKLANNTHSTLKMLGITYISIRPSDIFVLVWNIFFTVFKINHHTRSKTVYRIFFSFFFIIHLSLSFRNGLIDPAQIKHQSYKFSLIFLSSHHLNLLKLRFKKATSKRPDTFQITSRKKEKQRKDAIVGFFYYEDNEEVTKARTSQLVIVIVKGLATSKCSTTTKHDQCCF